MSILSSIPIVGQIIDGASKLISEVITDKDKKTELEYKLKALQLDATLQLQKIEHDEVIAQIEINKLDAQSNNAMQRNWRPFIGWCCGLAFAFNFICVPLLKWALVIASTHYPELLNVVPPPTLDMSEMMPVLLAMLGFGGFRTYEKINKK